MFIWYEIFFWRKRISMFRWQSSYLAYMRIYLHLSSLHTTDTAANHVTQAGCWISKWRTSEATSTKCGCGVWDDATHPARHSCECNKTLQRSFKIRKEDENKQRRGSCTIITIPFPRERPSEEKRKTYQEHATKSIESDALTAGTFERRNLVMQIRFSTMIFLFHPRVS